MREALGLTTAWCAAHVGGVAERSWKFWEQGRSPPPADVAERMRQLDAKLTAAAGQAVAQAQRVRIEHGQPSDVALVRYRTDAELWAAHPAMQGLPTTYHAALLTRARLALERHGFSVTIGYAEPEPV